MNLITCNIGFDGDVQLAANDKFEIDDMLSRRDGIDKDFGNSVTEITVTYYPSINFGIMGFRLDEPSDPEVGYEGGDMGVNYLCFSSSLDINKVVRTLIQRASVQKVPMGFNPSWSLKSKKVMNLEGNLPFIHFVIGYDEFEDDLDF